MVTLVVVTRRDAKMQGNGKDIKKCCKCAYNYMGMCEVDEHPGAICPLKQEEDSNG